jgi:hypothetical protein
MTIHSRIELLAASAIDFDLTPADQADLADHLATCSPCRSTTAGYRRDAAALREIAVVEPPARVRSALLEAMARPTARTVEPWKLLAVAALLLAALVGAAFAAGAFNVRHTPVVEVPIASPSQRLTATAAPSGTPSAAKPVVVLDPSTAHWTKVGVVDGSGPLAAFDGGYAMLAPAADGNVTLVRFSADGRAWQTSDLANLVANCPGFGPPGNDQVVDAMAAAIATNGHDLVIVGEVQPHDAAACAGGGSYGPVAWYSADGRTWQRSAPFEVSGGNARATAVWATPTGWQASVSGGSDAIWESSDGRTWRPVSDPSATLTGRDLSAVGAALDGTILVSRLPDVPSGDTSGPGLFSSSDGMTWQPVTSAGGCDSNPGATRIVGPTASGVGAWVVIDDVRLCVSRDLASWSSTTMTVAPAALAQTRYGAIVTGDACFGAGATCAPDPRAYLTTDGVQWSPIAHPPVVSGDGLADGPAGVLLIGQGTVWRLDP